MENEQLDRFENDTYQKEKEEFMSDNVQIAWVTLMRIPMSAIIIFVRARYHQSTNRSDNPTTIVRKGTSNFRFLLMLELVRVQCVLLINTN